MFYASISSFKELKVDISKLKTNLKISSHMKEEEKNIIFRDIRKNLN